MFKTGLTSITFRKCSADEIIAMAKEADLDGIEWGGDVHVLPGDLKTASDVKAKTEAAGLSVCSYGSYFRCEEDEDFQPVLDSAVALGAPVIRVWAGKQSPDAADTTYRTNVVNKLRHAVELAEKVGVTVALEYHGNTLTETQTSAHQILAEVGSPALKLYWQPRTGGEFAEDLIELEAALPHLSHIHAFHWGKNGFKDRYPFADGLNHWKSYLQLAQKAGGERYVIFEFVRDDQPAQFLADTKALHTLLSEIQ